MADQSETNSGRKRGPSVPMLVIGFLALSISAWALAAPGGFRDPSGGFSIGWTLVIGAIVAGVLLVISPRKRR
ncbi:hypothetical protein ACFVMC_01415 [Nocardia sp. NPDC127579]|uniref:hypothetical protein n=1 Tax=Nocardia sp. NPDC127579 TaxID=3345402 RepID=UPI003628654C